MVGNWTALAQRRQSCDDTTSSLLIHIDCRNPALVNCLSVQAFGRAIASSGRVVLESGLVSCCACAEVW